MRARHLLVPLLLLTPVAACSNDEADAPTGPAGLDVRGVYEVTGSFEMIVEQYDNGASVGLVFLCAGTVAVPTQTGNRFNGTWSLQAGGDCPEDMFGTMSGTVDGDSIEVSVDFQLPDRETAVQGITGCVITSGNENTFHGFIDPDNGSVFLDAAYTADCTFGQDVSSFPFNIAFEPRHQISAD